MTAEPTTATIRRYRDSDLAAVYDICVRTADAGQDARGKYRSDDLMPNLFAGPYVFLEPDVAFVLDDGHQAVGYVVGTPGLPEYPAHLHIDVLPGFQGAGYGRRLLAAFCDAVAQAGAAGVHVCVVTDNIPAIGFYRRLGFGTLAVDDPGPVVYLGRKL